MLRFFHPSKRKTKQVDTIRVRPKASLFKIKTKTGTQSKQSNAAFKFQTTAKTKSNVWGSTRRLRHSVQSKHQRPFKYQRQLTNTRQRLIRLCLLLSLTGMATHSITANASVLDPIRWVLSPFINLVSKNDNEAEEDLPESGGLFTEQASLDPNAASHPATTNNDRLALTAERPSLLNVMQAEFMVDRGDIDSALKIYKQESFKKESTTVFERALELSLLYDMPEESLEFALQWQQQNPEHIPALFYVAHLALKANNYDLAGDVLGQILDYDPQADLSEILIGIYPTTDQDQRLLLETLLSLPKHDNPSLLVMQAGLMSQLGQPDIALVSINRALRSKPDNAAFIVLKSDILKQLEPDREVLQYVSGERKRLKDNKSLYLYEIRYRLELGQTQDAWNLLIKAHDLFHDDEVTLLAALVSIDIEAYDTADELLSGLASSPSYIDQSYYYLGISAERQQKYERAERFLSKVMQESLVLQARQKLVSIQLLKGNPEQALETLTKFSQQFEVYAPESAIMQAEILRQQDKLIEANKVLADANRRYPDDTKLLFARAQLLDNDKDAALKRRLLDRLILINPEDPNYLIALATLLFESNSERDVEQALTLAQTVLDIPFNSPQFDQNNYLAALNLVAADALSEARYEDVIAYLEDTYSISPTLDSGILLLRAYQGMQQEDKVINLFNDIQQRFAVGQQDLSDRLQSY
ncbi:tetratricopeptide repeat protein [Psychrobacter sp. FDAARGOS_221]|uniref:tetratricopeptide repeat protein n=1 Tax=Psychrobacter sp. FDAARGOS_221 TaxID=1975705 RepID=UPI001D0D7B32|nr:hypothetical protein [Psychrobacter sp. FDAARGOS_221]